MTQQSVKLSRKTLLIFLLFGTVGQIAWCIENSFLNLYVNRTISTNLLTVTAMVAASAVVATLTTIVMGYFIDRTGKRRPFMVYGYMLWGVSVMLFALFTRSNMQKLGMSSSAAIVVASVGMVIMDCVMTFFGSTSNDAAFNAYVTDNTTKDNRGKIEALLSVLAVVAYLLVFAPFEMTGITQNKYYAADGTALKSSVGADPSKTVTGNWTLFYCVLGAVVIIAGIVGFFMMRTKQEMTAPKGAPLKVRLKRAFVFEQDMPAKKDMKFKDLFYGFRPSVIKRNKYLYLVLATVMIAYVANNCFSNFTAIYLQRTLEADKYIPLLGYMLPWGLSMGLAFIAGIIAGVILDKTKTNKMRLLLPGIAASCVGSLIMYFTSPDFIGNIVANLSLFCVGSFIQSMGSSVIGIVCLGTVRNLTPADKTGRFQGVRMVFVVMLPMVVGSIISGVISSTPRFAAGVDEFGQTTYTCPPIMFLLAAIVVIVAIIPTIFLLKAKPDDLITPAEGLTAAQLEAATAAQNAAANSDSDAPATDGSSITNNTTADNTIVDGAITADDLPTDDISPAPASDDISSDDTTTALASDASPDDTAPADTSSDT